jgi:hypothetical protein
VDSRAFYQGLDARDGHPVRTQDYQNVAIDIGRKYIGAEFMRDLPRTEDMPHEDSNIIISEVNLAAAHGRILWSVTGSMAI